MPGPRMAYTANQSADRPPFYVLGRKKQEEMSGQSCTQRLGSGKFCGTVSPLSPLNTMVYLPWIMSLLLLGGVAALIVLQLRPKQSGEYDRIKQEYDRKIEEIGMLKAEADELYREKEKIAEKGKQIYDTYKTIEGDLKSVRQERDTLQGTVQRFQAEEQRKEKEFDERLGKLEAAKLQFEAERQRIIREDEEAQQLKEEERDRLWADHEHSVISLLTDLCKQPALAFSSFTNTHLPEGFDGSLKPDFMIEFLGQYIIFDAKVSKAKSLQTYITKQVEDTVAKVKDNDRIYKRIFLVVPTQAVTELKKHHYVQDGYHIFVISPEAIPAILSSLKHITLYEFAETLDPKQRENIVQLIAELDFHINLRNATDIVLSKMGIDLLEKAQRTNPALAEEVAIKKQPMNAKASIATSEIKKIVSQLTAQNVEIQQLVSPRPAILDKDLDTAEELLEETLS